MTDFNTSGILEVLSRHEVAYILIGGYAALVQGSGMATIDIDFVPERTRTNLSNLAAALKGMDAKIRAAGTHGLAFSASVESLRGVSVLNLTTRFGDLDLAFAPSGFAEGFTALRESATTMTIDGVRVLDDVIASKEAAARDKNFAALPHLIRLRQEQESPGLDDA